METVYDYRREGVSREKASKIQATMSTVSKTIQRPKTSTQSPDPSMYKTLPQKWVDCKSIADSRIKIVNL